MASQTLGSTCRVHTFIEILRYSDTDAWPASLPCPAASSSPPPCASPSVQSKTRMGVLCFTSRARAELRARPPVGPRPLPRRGLERPCCWKAESPEARSPQQAPRPSPPRGRGTWFWGARLQNVPDGQVEARVAGFLESRHWELPAQQAVGLEAGGALQAVHGDQLAAVVQLPDHSLDHALEGGCHGS